MAETEKPTVESLTKLIDAEIAEASGAEARAGWTPWVLLVGLGAVCWTILDQLPGTHAAAALAFMLAFDELKNALWIAWGMASPRLPRWPGKQRYTFGPPSLGGMNAVTLLGIARMVGVVGIVLAVAVQMGLVALTLAVLLIVGEVWALIAPVAFPRLTGGRSFMVTSAVPVRMKIWVAPWAWIVLRLAFVGAMFHWLTSVSSGAWTHDARVGGLGAAALFLLVQLAAREPRSKVTARLRRLRQELLLGLSHPRDVAREVEVMLMGMTATAALQAPMQGLLDAIQACRENFKLMADSIQAAELDMQRLEGHEVSESERVAVVSRLKDVAKREVDHAALVMKVTEARKHWDGALRIVDLAGEKEEADPLRAAVDQQLDRVNAEKLRFQEQAKVLRRRREKLQQSMVRVASMEPEPERALAEDEETAESETNRT